MYSIVLCILTFAARLAVCASILAPRTDCSTHPASEAPCPSKHVSPLTLLAAIGIPVLIVVIAIGGYIFHVFRRSSNKVYTNVPPSSAALLPTTSTKSIGSTVDREMTSYSDSLAPSTMTSDFGATPRTKMEDYASSSQVREPSTPETARTMYGYGVGVI